MGQERHTFATLFLLSCVFACDAVLHCMYCHGIKNVNLCKSQPCPKPDEDGCYMQINKKPDNLYTVHAMCISHHTCNDLSWRGYDEWHGDFVTNGCCHTTNCNKALYTNALKKATTSHLGHHTAHPPATTAHTTTHLPHANHHTSHSVPRTCYECDGVGRLEDCKANQACTDDQEMCYMQVNKDSKGEVKMYARCMAKETCPNSQTGTWTKVAHYVTDVCEGCCTGDDCNSDICTGGPPTASPVVPHRLTSGIECSVCIGGTCGLSRSDAVSKCPDAFPYCMNTVENDANGNKFITKRCASESDCEGLWWQGSSSNAICSIFDPNHVYTTPFTCHYCCLTPNCNRDMHPAPVTLFVGTSD